MLWNKVKFGVIVFPAAAITTAGVGRLTYRVAAGGEPTDGRRALQQRRAGRTAPVRAAADAPPPPKKRPAGSA